MTTLELLGSNRSHALVRQVASNYLNTVSRVQVEMTVTTLELLGSNKSEVLARQVASNYLNNVSRVCAGGDDGDHSGAAG